MGASARRNDVTSIASILVRRSRILHNNGTATAVLAVPFVHGAQNGLNAVEVRQCSLCILAFLLVFKPYLSNAFVSAKSPDYFSCPCSTEDVAIAHKPPRSL